MKLIVIRNLIDFIENCDFYHPFNEDRRYKDSWEQRKKLLLMTLNEELSFQRAKAMAWYKKVEKYRRQQKQKEIQGQATAMCRMCGANPVKYKGMCRQCVKDILGG